jgi:cytochrome c-type biogenesis protein CcmE
MTKTKLKFTIAGVMLVGAIAYLAYAGMTDGWVSYHLTVDAFLADAKYQSQRVRLAGRVSDEGLVVGSGRLGARFALLGGERQVPVKYGRVLPDLFKGGCDVVVEGRLDKAGVFQAEDLMTKCASKYDSAEHGMKKTEKPS